METRRAVYGAPTLRNLTITSSCRGLVSRSQGDVKGGVPISVHFIPAFNASEKGLSSPIPPAGVPAPGAGLAGVPGVDKLDRYAVLPSDLLDGFLEKVVGGSSDLAISLPAQSGSLDASQVLDGDEGVVSPCKPHEFMGDLIAPCFVVALLIPSELSEGTPCPTGALISFALEPASSDADIALNWISILSKVELRQNLIPNGIIHRDGGKGLRAHIHADNILALFYLEVLLHGDEDRRAVELEVSEAPVLLKVSLESLVGSVLRYWQGKSLPRSYGDGENWIASLSLLEGAGARDVEAWADSMDVSKGLPITPHSPADVLHDLGMERVFGANRRVSEVVQFDA